MSNARIRVPFTRDDMRHLESWLAHNHPTNERRLGNQIWKELMDDPKARPWNGRHTWSSWREHYKSNEEHYVKAVSKAVKSKPPEAQRASGSGDEEAPKGRTNPKEGAEKRPQTVSKKSTTKNPPVLSSSSTEEEESEHEESRPLKKNLPIATSVLSNDEEDIKNLAEYFASAGIKEAERGMAPAFQDLINEPSCKKWARRKAGVQWRAFYREHKEAIDKQTASLMGGTMSRRLVPKKALKRRHSSDEDSGTEKNDNTDNTDSARMIKKRRVSKKESISRKNVPSSKKTPTSIVPGTPSSNAPDLPDPAMNRVSPAPLDNSSRLGAYGIIGTPSGSVSSPMAGNEEDQLLKTPIIAGTDMADDSNYISPLRITPTPEVERTTSVSLSGPEPNQVDETPSRNADTPQAKVIPDFKPLKLGIFPREFPHLTPTLRPGQNGKKEPGAIDNLTQQRAVGPLNTPPLTPSTHSVLEGANDSPIQAADATSLQNEEDATQEDMAQYVSADEMYWGFAEQPSPMPEMGSEGRSSRSHSLAYERLTERLRGPMQAESFVRQVVETGKDVGEDVDELAEDPLEPESISSPAPRFIVPRRSNNHQSRSPLFASSSASEDEKPVKSKAPNKTLRYPVKAQVTAAGLIRQRGGRPSKPHFESSDGEESTQHQTGNIQSGSARLGEEDKENMRVQEENMGTVPLYSQEESPQPQYIHAPRPSVKMVYQEVAENGTGEAHLPSKELNLTGRTPPSPKEPVRTIRHDVITPDFEAITQRALGNTLFDEQISKLGPRMRHALSRSVPAFNKNRASKVVTMDQTRTSPANPIEASGSEDEPSPLKRKADRVQSEAEGDGGGKGKVRFDGIPVDGQRRRTTGGMGFTFGMGGSKGTISEPKPAIRSGDRLSLPKPQDVMNANTTIDGVIELSDDEEEKQSEDSPLARYSHAATSSPQKPKAKTVGTRDRNEMSIAHGRSSLGARPRRSYMPPPPAKKVPVVIDASSSPVRSSQHSVASYSEGRNNAATRNPPVGGGGARAGGVAVQDFATAKWSPFKFLRNQSYPQQTQESYFASQSQNGSQKSASVVAGTGLSMDYRDQHVDAEWVESVHGRPVLVTREISRGRRSAPLPTKDEVVVYNSSSRSPSRRRSRASSSRRQSRRRSEVELEERALNSMTDADKRVVWKYLFDNGLVTPEDDVEASTMADGLAYVFEQLARDYELAPSIPRRIWYKYGDLLETEQALQDISDGTKQLVKEKFELLDAGLKDNERWRRDNEARKRRKGQKSCYGEDRRERARQFVDRVRAEEESAEDEEETDSLSESDQEDSEDDNGDGSGFVSGRPSRRQRSSTKRGETPEYVPLAVVVKP